MMKIKNKMIEIEPNQSGIIDRINENQQVLTSNAKEQNMLQNKLYSLEQLLEVVRSNVNVCNDQIESLRLCIDNVLAKNDVMELRNSKIDELHNLTNVLMIHQKETIRDRNDELETMKKSMEQHLQLQATVENHLREFDAKTRWLDDYRHNLDQSIKSQSICFLQQKTDISDLLTNQKKQLEDLQRALYDKIEEMAKNYNEEMSKNMELEKRCRLFEERQTEESKKIDQLNKNNEVLWEQINSQNQQIKVLTEKLTENETVVDKIRCSIDCLQRQNLQSEVKTEIVDLRNIQVCQNYYAEEELQQSNELYHSTEIETENRSNSQILPLEILTERLIDNETVVDEILYSIDRLQQQSAEVKTETVESREMNERENYEAKEELHQPNELYHSTEIQTENNASLSKIKLSPEVKPCLENSLRENDNGILINLCSPKVVTNCNLKRTSLSSIEGPEVKRVDITQSTIKHTSKTPINIYSIHRIGSTRPLRPQNIVKLISKENILNVEFFDYFWTVNDLNSKRENATAGHNAIVTSNPFYTHKNGYRLCLKLHLNGISTYKNKYICVAFEFLNGDFDDYLEWPCRWPVEISVLYQDTIEIDEVYLTKVYQYDELSEKRVFDRPKSERKDYGHPNFLKWDDLLVNDRVYRNDSIRLRCRVRPA